MEDKLRAYMDHLFREVEPTKRAVELKEEILQNLLDKYHDLLAEGKSEEASYNIAVASIGDTQELLAGLKQEGTCCEAYTNEDYEKARKKSALLTSVAIMMYIVCVVPVIIMDRMHIEVLGVCLMFLLIAAATGILVYNAMSKPRYHRVDDSIVEEFKEWQEQTDSKRNAKKAISSALWSLITVIYILVSFSTGAWHISWVIFLMGGATEGIIKAVFELKGQ